MQIEVIRSKRRKKTVQLRPTPNGVRISIPFGTSAAEEQRYVEQLLRRYEKQKKSSSIDLVKRARSLADRYGLQHPSVITWSQNQNSLWGSCTPAHGSVRISSSVASFPGWVIDYVIVHELAHLSFGGHGPAFWKLVSRYERTERARGFLIAKGLDMQDHSGSEAEGETGSAPGGEVTEDQSSLFT